MSRERAGAYGVRLILTVFVILTFCRGNAWAYVDPGSGFMLWQLLVSALIGALFYFRKAIRSIIGWKRKRDDK